MKVKDRMARDVVTVTMNDNVNDALKILHQKNIRRVPVVEGDTVVGMLTLMDLNRAAASPATSLSKSELNYLLAKMTVRDALPRHQQVISIEAEEYIEEAARLMREYRISGLPVLDQGALVGVITETDIFDAFIELLGVKKVHTRIDLYAEDRIGGLAEMTGIVAQAGKNILNTNIFLDNSNQKYRLILRIEGHDCQDVIEELKKKFEVLATKEIS